VATSGIATPLVSAGQPARPVSSQTAAGRRALDLDQDRPAKAATNPVQPTADQGASVKTLRQLLSGDDVIQLVIRLGLLALLVIWTFIVIRPFVPILAWSVVLAVAFYPLFDWLAKLLGGRPRTAAAIITIINLGIIIGPATWLGLSAVDGVRQIAGHLTAGDLVVPSPPEQVKEWRFVGPKIYELWSQAANNIRAVLREVAPYLKPVAGVLLGLAGSAGVGTLKFLLSVFVAGFLFPYGPQMVGSGSRLLSRIIPEQSEHFVELAGATIRAVSQGVIGVAVVQALLAGIGFKMAGIASAGLLALAVMLLAIVQIGAAIVVFPVIFWIWIDKEFTTALLLTVFLVVVGVLDNILKPLLMGRSLTTPTIVVFLGVIGGTLAHGIVGLFIGPVILSVAWELTAAWMRDDRAKPAPRLVADP
jgi:predicted PurR-regulated permease PerM